MAIDYEALKPITQNHRRGEEHPGAVVTEETVREIRRLHLDGIGYVRIGRAVGISPSQVRSIVKRISWAHVA